MSVKTYEEWLQEPLVQIAHRMAERRVWAELWKRKAKELYRVIGAFDEEHASIVASNIWLAHENGIMREALEVLSRKENHRYLPSIPPVVCKDAIKMPAWEYAQSKLDELERGE